MACKKSAATLRTALRSPKMMKLEMDLRSPKNRLLAGHAVTTAIGDRERIKNLHASLHLDT